MSLSSSRRAWQIYVIVYCDGGQRSDHFQSGTTGADRTTHDGGRARGGGSDTEVGGDIFSNMMLEMDFSESFGSVPLYVENTSALHVTSNRTYSPRASISR